MTAPGPGPLATVLGVLDTYTLECLDSDFKSPPASRRLMEQAAADLTAVVLAAVEDAGPAVRVEELLRLLYYGPQNPDIYCAIADSYRDAGGRDIAKSFYMMAAVAGLQSAVVSARLKPLIRARETSNESTPAPAAPAARTTEEDDATDRGGDSAPSRGPGRRSGPLDRCQSQLSGRVARY